MTDADTRATMYGDRRQLVPYPPAPWHARGRCWAGAFRADTPAALPSGLKPLLGSRWRVLVLVRYEAGSTLRYDELLVGPLTRCGMRAGIYVEHIYVDSVASLRGGQEIWGLPKRLATFTWQDGQCSVADSDGTIAVLRLDVRPTTLPIYLPLVAPAFGHPQAGLAQLVAPVLARLGHSRLRLEAWSPRFAYRLPHRPLLSVAAQPFRARFPEPVFLR